MSSYFMGVCCPQCDELAYATVNTSLRYNAVSCDECGYYDYAEDLGNEETVEEAEHDGWEVFLGEEGFWKIKISQGYGTIWFAKKEGGGFGVAFSKPVAQQSIDRILQRFEHPMFDKSRCMLKVWDMKRHCLRYIHPTE